MAMPDQCEKYRREARIIRPNEHALTQAERQYAGNAAHGRGEDCPNILRVSITTRTSVQPRKLKMRHMRAIEIRLE